MSLTDVKLSTAQDRRVAAEVMTVAMSRGLSYEAAADVTRMLLRATGRLT